ncbi:hypothetical protein Poly51_25730 [Rubripirellula tenax]|uniref:Right handed beta helix domain-containing protein n=1 Tax=Rubripirellula tenax TaxID=2528015 RepID=A0A5C6F8H2_9BACT|nr:right-handed parallel beta-helix repeat-containing protein [Rubripirellula tenax]TWU56657.1 hypothetical protein Poly51_25730 [Rubripirellula tenax]
MLLNKISLAVLIALNLPSAAFSATIELGPDGDWFSILSGDRLAPGDEVVLRQGVYSDARRLVIRHCGVLGKPITIRCATHETVVFKRPDAKQNTLNLEGTQHLQLVGFEITGGSSGIRIGPYQGRQPSDVVLEGLHIHDIGGVAVTCNHEAGDYKRMTFRGNHIHHTGGHGEAFYLGGNNGTAIISDSLIEDNYIHHLDGDNISQGDGVEIKQGSYGNRIVSNVIHDTKYPGITVYGTAGRTQNLIEHNLIWNTGDHGIQAAADSIIRNNFIADAGGCGIYSREHQRAVPNSLRIEGNFVITRKNAALRIIGSTSEATGSGVQLIANRLFTANGHPAIRIDNVVKVSIDQNRGQGEIIGKDVDSKQWSTLTQPDHVDFPELSGHLVWRYLRRSIVESIFTESVIRK